MKVQQIQMHVCIYIYTYFCDNMFENIEVTLAYINVLVTNM